MTKEELYAHPGWEWCTFEGARKQVHLIGLETTFREKLQWLEEAETLALQLRGRDSAQDNAIPLVSLRERIEAALLRECQRFYRERLISLASYGSVARGDFGPLSDFDFLLVVDPLPQGNPACFDEFQAVSRALQAELEICRSAGWQIRLAPIFKIPAAVEYGSPLFLDMVEDARILFDRDGYFARRLDRLRERLRQLGSKRIWEGDTWYWDLKPNWKRGDVIEL